MASKKNCFPRAFRKNTVSAPLREPPKSRFRVGFRYESAMSGPRKTILSKKRPRKVRKPYCAWGNFDRFEASKTAFFKNTDPVNNRVFETPFSKPLQKIGRKHTHFSKRGRKRRFRDHFRAKRGHLGKTPSRAAMGDYRKRTFFAAKTVQKKTLLQSAFSIACVGQKDIS